MARTCWGEGPGKPPCATPPVMHTQNLLAPAAVMDFCRRCFWRWVAASLTLRGEPELTVMAPGILRHVRAGNFDGPPRPPVEAIPYSMVAPDVGFDDEEA